MKARQKSDRSTQPVRPLWTRWALWFLSGMISVALFAMIGIGLWFQNSLNQFKTFESETRSAYTRLNEEFPFVVADDASSIPPARIDAYFRARSAALDLIPPQLDKMTETLLKDGSVKRIELLQGFNASLDPLRRAVRAHVAELRSEKMSLNEYLWLHGIIMHAIFSNGDPRRGRLEQTVARLDTIFDVSDWIEDGGFRAEDFAHGLEIAYADAPAIAPETLTALEVERPTARVIDVLAANHTRAARSRDANLNASESESKNE